jgi:hypothetical protein
MILSFQHQDQTIECEVLYRKRKTIEIQIKESGTVRLLVPMGTTKKRIMEVLQLKTQWIVEKLAKVQRVNKLTTKVYTDGEQFLYLGNNYILKVKVDGNTKKPFVTLDNDQLLVTTDTAEASIIKKTLELWYREKAQELIGQRVAYYQQWLKIGPTEIKVKEQKKRWGSCTSAGKLLFNWRIVMAPLPIIDYLVVHEMCHLHQMNHSKNFWYLVGSVLPDYQARRNWLKEHGAKLDMG